MDALDKIIVALGIVLIIVVAIGMFLPSITGTGKHITNNTSTKILSMEANAIKNSSPITIKHWKVFGTWTNITKNITYQQQAYFELSNPSQLNVLYNGYYFPIYLNVKSFGFFTLNLKGEKVYLNFIANDYKNISAPYIVKSEVIKNNEEYWNFTFDGNTSNAINSMLNPATANITISYLNGVILLNETATISPKNPTIDEILHKT